MELPYDSAVEYGRGYNHHTEQFVALAFEEYTDDIHKQPSTLESPYERRVVKSTRSFSEAIRTTATVQGSGWGMTAKADAAFERDITMTVKDVVFLIHASKRLGF